MAYTFLDTLRTASVRDAQAANGSAAVWENLEADRAFDRIDERVGEFIAARDSFYLASVSESGWPYVQHRGGPAGFLRVLDETTLGFADFRGNRQYISLGNIGADDRVSLILMDYPNKARLKILAHMSAVDLTNDPKLAEQLSMADYKAKPERAMILKLSSYDWNCPQHITPRFTAAEIAPTVLALRDRVAALEAENLELRDGARP